MKDLKHIKRFNESEENLNISGVSDSYIQKIVSELFDEHFINDCDEIYDAQQDIEEYAKKCINQIIKQLK